MNDNLRAVAFALFIAAVLFIALAISAKPECL